MVRLTGPAMAMIRFPAAACLLACFLDLLATFIGAELTARLVAGIRRVDGLGRGSEEK